MIATVTETTPSLHDWGEERWPLRVHLGCGGVYLAGYTNIDVDDEGVSVQAATSQAISANLTNASNYYARLAGSALALPERRRTIFDLQADIVEGLPYETGQVDKILAIQCFDHLTPVKALEALDRWWNILTPGGVLILTVPDTLATFDLIETGTPDERAFGLRHLRGPRRDEYGFHVAWYTPETLTGLMKAHGFETELIDNIHFYPAICVRGRKRT